jgi:hypothetical protein
MLLGLASGISLLEMWYLTLFALDARGVPLVGEVRRSARGREVEGADRARGRGEPLQAARGRAASIRLP